MPSESFRNHQLYILPPLAEILNQNMNLNDLLLEKVNHALELSKEALGTKYKTEDSLFVYVWVKPE